MNEIKMDFKITKELFIKSINKIKKQFIIDNKAHKAFEVILPNDYVSVYDNSNLYEGMIELLKYATNDSDGWIEYYIYELDFGGEFKDGMVRVHNENFRLKTVNDLWGILNIE